MEPRIFLSSGKVIETRMTYEDVVYALARAVVAEDRYGRTIWFSVNAVDGTYTIPLQKVECIRVCGEDGVTESGFTEDLYKAIEEIEKRKAVV